MRFLLNTMAGLLFFLFAIFASLFLGFVLGAAWGVPPQAVATIEPATAVLFAPAMLPTETPVPLTPQEAVQTQLRQVFGTNNRTGDESLTTVEFTADIINVKWAMSDSASMVDSAEIDITNALRAIDETGIDYYLVNFEGTFSLTDANGNTSEQTVVWATYPKETVNTINWDDFLWRNVLDSASTHKLHPAIEE